MTRPVDEEPWILAKRFSGEISSALGPVLLDVMVVGSATLGDWRPESDIDLVCVAARTLRPQEIDALSRIHAGSRCAYGHTIDAVYVTAECLSLGPDSVDSVVESVAGVVHHESTDGQLNWVTWLNILQSGVRIGPGIEDVERVRPENSGISIPEADVRDGAVAYSATNLDEYWGNRITLSERMYMATSADDPIPQFEIEWMSLGPARLLATVLTGRVVSKSDGGRFAADRFPGFTAHMKRVLDARIEPDASRTWTRNDLKRSLDLALRCVELGTVK